jgi:hypothetical protein
MPANEAPHSPRSPPKCRGHGPLLRLSGSCFGDFASLPQGKKSINLMAVTLLIGMKYNMKFTNSRKSDEKNLFFSA